MVLVLNFGAGNIGSIYNMLCRIGAAPLVSSSPEDVLRARKIILPGVGAFDAGMSGLESAGLIPALRRRVLDDGVPLLGLCLGMQMLMSGSEEGQRNGLGWIEGEVVRFQATARFPKLKIPHMGWNIVHSKSAEGFFSGMEKDARFYFAHSYHVLCRDEQDVLAVAAHGGEFVAAVQRKNVMGVQFHPEKSHRFGMQLLKNFVKEV